MSSQPRAALRAAVAIITAVSVAEPTVSVQELLDDADPLEVLALIAHALHSTMGVAVGAKGRAAVLQTLGLDAAKAES